MSTASIDAAIEQMLGYPDGSYMRCPFCGGKSRSMHKDDCAIVIVAAALRAPSAGVQSAGVRREDVLDEAIAACNGERLHEQYGTEDDTAYTHAIDDCVCAIGNLKNVPDLGATEPK